MKKIIGSLTVIALVLLMSAGATRAYFSDTATINDNTFATGTLEIRVNGEPTVLGAKWLTAVPGVEYTSPDYHINNFGPEFFPSGPSNLTAKKLLLNVSAPNDWGSGLWDEVMVRVEVNRGWSTWHVAYVGLLKELSDEDLLSPRWTELVPGESEMLKYTVWLPGDAETDQSSYMGKTLMWNFVIEGRTQ